MNMNGIHQKVFVLWVRVMDPDFSQAAFCAIVGPDGDVTDYLI